LVSLQRSSLRAGRPQQLMDYTQGPINQSRKHGSWLALGLGSIGLVCIIAALQGGSQRSNLRENLVKPTQLAVSDAVVKDPLGGVGAPLAKRIVVSMDTNVNFHVAWNQWKPWSKEMSPWWTEDMIYDFIYVGDWKFGKSHGLPSWYHDEHLHFNKALPDAQWVDFIRAANDKNCTSASYGPAQFTDQFAGVPAPPSKPWVQVRDLDFYLLEGDRIKINWCMIDVVDLFQQVGYNILPPAPMDTLGYLPPAAMDGVPAPLSATVNPETTKESEKIWRAAVKEDYLEGSSAAARWADKITWYGPGGVGTAHSKEEYSTHFLKPLHAAFSNMTSQVDMIVCEGSYCGAHFYLWADHVGEWLGQKATGKRVTLRLGAHARIQNGKIREGWLIIDVPRAFKTMGIDFYSLMTTEAHKVEAQKVAQMK